jgi:hypothetical protein
MVRCAHTQPPSALSPIDPSARASAPGGFAHRDAAAGSRRMPNKHLQSYLDEFVFRFNRRRTRHAAFRSLLGIAAAHQPLSYKMLISPEAKA